MGLIFDTTEIINLERSPGHLDLIIAATALSLDYEVATSNKKDFMKIDGL